MGNITIYICRRTVGVAVSNDLVSGLLKITKKYHPRTIALLCVGTGEACRIGVSLSVTGIMKP